MLGRAVTQLRRHGAAVALAMMVVACGRTGADATTPDRLAGGDDAASHVAAVGKDMAPVYSGPVAFTMLAEGLTVTFTDHSSVDVDGQQWVFGDGATSTAAAPVHAYSREGTYDVSETVTRASGEAAVRTLRLRVMALPPQLHNGEARPGLSAVGSYDLNFYARLPEGASRLAFELDGSVGDIDMFVRHGSVATEQDYDCRRAQEARVVACSFDVPAEGPYYVRLVARRSFSSASLKASWQEQKKAAHDAPPKNQ